MSIVVAGIGCRKDCPLADLLALLEQVVAEAGLTLDDLNALASSTHKRDEPGLQQLAHHLALPLALLPSEHLAGYHARLSQSSALALAITGSAGVAEASALAHAEALSGTAARLRCEKRSSARASIALAVASGA
ncbi:cobalamin biosynthesis protein [Pseudomonas sp. PDM14]|uniref:cobalamin biosynthesis protein n=1 Tax=Pseudomonas sp. PDM14 TaxID=2769288 RepID=UPI00177B0524|nr:cobalamin biosynthesis protein [Pseudomonas sp. PDM14]MBD9483929.1 cobalamin biosynthesis protein [Pseudomonas sp. PDM14]